MKIRKHSKVMLSVLLTLCILLGLAPAAICAGDSETAPPKIPCSVGEAVAVSAKENSDSLYVPEGTYESADNAVVSAARTAGFYVSGTANYKYAYEILDILNEHRAAHGLAPLTMDVDLLNTAMQRSAECIVYYDHTRPDGSRCFTAFPSRFSNSYRGENIAIGYTSPEDVMTGWKNSPGHNENMLTSEYTSVGIGCFYQNGTYSWSQLFSSVRANPATGGGSSQIETRAITATSEYLDLGVYPNVSSLNAGDEQEYLLTNTNVGWGYLTAAIHSNSARTTDSNVARVTGIDEFGTVCVKAINAGSTSLLMYITDANGNDIVTEMPIRVTGTAPEHTHNLTHTPKKDATCTASGNTEYWSCSGCGKYFSDSAASNEITLNSTVISAKGHDYQNNYCTRCGERDPNAPAEPGSFVDIKPTDFFYDAVNWAVETGVTTGTDGTHFSPGGNCTRGQTVTFLWRAMGEPEPETKVNPFTDVKPGDYYYKAVLWAYENKITTGKSASMFAPGADCTRGEVVTFLWRAENKPVASSRNPFSDVGISDYYYNAVIWAYMNEITSGKTATTFKPGSDCTRGEVVTFLYRDIV